MGSNEDHSLYAIELASYTTFTRVLMTVIKLKVLEAIAEAGPDAQLTAHEIVSRLLIPNQDAPDMIDRMLRVLASYSIVTCTQGVYESRPVRVYGLTPVAKYFIPNEDGASLIALMQLSQDKVAIDTWSGVEDSIIEGGVAFEKVHGIQAYKYSTLDARYNEVFNNAMLNQTNILMKKILECYNGFNNLQSLVDVGGGLGITTNMIVTQHPNIKGINFDLPHVIERAPLYPGIQHVGGDMFKEVPQGDAIFMKSILHNWSDDHCVKLLKNCYKAIPIDGKVIVVDGILPFLSDTSSSSKLSTQKNVNMMIMFHGGKERTEDEFLALAKDAGFMGVTKKCFVCNFWVMEFYK